MPLPKFVFVCVTLWLGIVAPAQSAEWRVDAQRSDDGRSVDLDTLLRGDGATSDAQVTLVHDVSRLQIESIELVVPEAQGFCGFGPDSRVRAFRFSEDGRPVPRDPQLLCRVRYSVRSGAPAGVAVFAGTDLECVGATGSLPCEFVGTTVPIDGISLDTPPPFAPYASIAIRLAPDPRAPTVEDIASIDFSQPGFADRVPFAILRELPPVLAQPLLQNRAKGDAKALLARYPHTARAKLERYVVLLYERDDQVAIERVMQALRTEPFVESVEVARSVELTSEGAAKTGGIDLPYHLDALAVETAWEITEGWALLGFSDTGLATQHPAFKSFSNLQSTAGTYLGGNYLPYYSFTTLSFTSQQHQGVQPGTPDEAAARAATQNEFNLGCARPVSDPICQLVQDPMPFGCLTFDFLGHGSHVAGLAAAIYAGSTTRGVCPGCAIGMTRFFHPLCQLNGDVRAGFSHDQVAGTAAELGIAGAQVISMSLRGFTLSEQVPNCNSSPNDFLCQKLTALAARDVVLVASSGNNRTSIDFPASDARVISAGGLNEVLGFWDDAPNCPQIPGQTGNFQCGSNYTISGQPGLQELVAPAKNVYSTFYPNEANHNIIPCGDFIGDPVGDGYGLCTGTSMSAPQIAGLVGLLRSTNPLLPTGTPSPVTGSGLRRVLSMSTDRSAQALGWDPQFGYGLPHAGRALQGVLGVVREWPNKNRATPLFALYSPGFDDYAVTASPQSAASLMTEQNQAYETVGSFIEGQAVQGYGTFPAEITLEPPRAALFVMTTPNKPRPSYPALKPLFWVEKSTYSPAGCTPRSWTCNATDRDNTFVSSVADLESLVNAGYAFKGRQGFVYERCTPEPACMPPGTVKIYRKCSFANDCAVFGEPQRLTFEAAGYTQALPAASDVVLGYAYPSGDGDLPQPDGLPDAMEHVIGTSVNDADSDGDGFSDAYEYPLAGVPTGDPCAGPAVVCTVPAEIVFRDSFE